MIKAINSDKQLIVDLLVRAFDSNPSVNYIIKQDQKRKERIHKLMEYSLEICHDFGAVYLSSDRKACALTLLPDKKRVNFKTILLDIQFVLFVIGLSKIKTVLKREKLIEIGYPKEPMFYLWFLAVDPGDQRRGIGSALLKEIIEESKILGRDIYLETSLPENVLFYEKHGFKVYNELSFNQVLYCMARLRKP